MLQKWKIIINNWINCYFNESTKTEHHVSIESLLDIISHLRDNLNLDESKSSRFEAHTVQEFVLEKYPEFKFENGTVEARSEDEEYLVASLLLFFVCVNSKDVDLKSAMCSKLSAADQEIILKFSKSLMECSPITCRDVHTAITDACGVDLVTMEAPHVTVAETPPALRSLHGEVRRLQAALDAERFDRNYLQEELNRTNLRLDKLLKDKEQYKLDIVNLKAKISMCCGQEQDSKGTDAGTQSSVRLNQQLEDMEERLVKTLEQLEETVYERDTYKAKVDELKQVRDKWLAEYQNESARAGQLAEELESERRNMASLRELVNELRQHNRLNRFDSSLLECDDPDTSIQSLQHNTSVCSEACANVVEVQLGEERAKVDALKQQLQFLQTELNKLEQQSENDKQSYEKIILERENEIFALKHRVNEEIEAKNTQDSNYYNEIIRLSNEMNELEQRIKENNEQSQQMVNSKMHEIKTLQEEKISLLQSFSDESTKLQNLISDLKQQIESEKQSKMKMRESYENQMMKMNEKVLNRNNELVELQDTIFEKGEKIEMLQLELRKEKALSNKYQTDLLELKEEKNTQSNNWSKKMQELNTMLQTLEKNIATKIKENDDYKLTVANLTQRCLELEQNKLQLEAEIIKRIQTHEDLHKDMENIKNTLSEEKEKLKFDLDEKKNIINKLQTQLKDEKQKYSQSFDAEINKMITKLNDTEKTIKDLSSNSKKAINSKDLQIQALNKEIEVLKLNLEQKVENITLMRKEKDTLIQKLQEEVSYRNKIEQEYQNQCVQLRDITSQLLNEIATKNSEINIIRVELEQVVKTFEEKCKEIGALEENIVQKENNFTEFKNKKNNEIDDLLKKLSSSELIICKLEQNIKNLNDSKQQAIEVMQKENEQLQFTIEEDNSSHEVFLKEKDCIVERLEQQLKNESMQLESLRTDYEDVTLNYEKYKYEVKESMEVKDRQISQLNNELKLLNRHIAELKSMRDELTHKIDTITKKMEGNESKYESEISRLLELVDSEKNKCLLLEQEKETLQYELALEKAAKNTFETEKKQQIEDIKHIVDEKNELLNAKMILAQQLAEEKSVRDIIDMEKNEVYAQKVLVEQQLEEEMARSAVLAKQTEKVLKQIESFTKETEILRKDKDTLSKQSEELENLSEKFKEEKEALVKHTESLSKEIESITKETEILRQDKETLAKLTEELKEEKENLNIQLETISKLADTLTEDKDALVKQTEILSKEIESITKETKILTHDKETLTKLTVKQKGDIETLRNQLETFSKLTEILTQEKETLSKQKETLAKLTDSLSKDKENLSQQLVEEKSANILSEKEKEFLKDLLKEKEMGAEYKEKNMIQQLNEMRVNRSTLEQQCMKETAMIEVLKDEKHNLVQELSEEKKSKELVIQQKQSLSHDYESLKQDLLEKNMIQEILMNDKELLVVEKEGLLKSLELEKVAHDEILTEKEQISVKLKELNESFSSELKNRKMELDKVNEEIKVLQKSSQSKEELNNQLCINLSDGITKLVESLKKEGITNEVLQKLIEEDNNDLKVNDKCDLLLHIANTLSTEIVMRKNLERALEHENMALGEMKDVLSQKEMQVFELQTEIKKLQQAVNENKIELSKRSEAYNTALETQLREMQVVQQEKQSLSNDLNDVKLQLEIKVHSLKEKLIDNEHLTDKLKKTYECQIDNLNVMITKLTNYLKDKTAELEAVRKEKDKLQQTIEENNQAIKLLEEEVKIEKQNQEKLINDFESERQVLKNMVSVTESVMEDQKTNLNTIISEHVKVNETLQQEVKSTKEKIEAERRNYEVKLREKEVAMESLFKDLAEIRLENKKMESKEQNLRTEITVLKKELQKKTVESEQLIRNIQILETDLTTFKIHIEAKEKENDESKIKLDAAESELKNKVDILTKEVEKQSITNNNLNTLLKEKVENIKHMDENLKELQDKINILEKEKGDLIVEKDENVTKLGAILATVESNMTKDNEQMAALRNEKEELLKVIQENYTVIAKLEQSLKDEKNQAEQLREDLNNHNLTLANKCAILQDYHTKAEKELEERQKEIVLLEKEIKTLQSKIDENESESVAKDDLIKTLQLKIHEAETSIKTKEETIKTLQLQVNQAEDDSKAKDGFISKMSKEKDAVIASVNKDLLQEKALKDKYFKELEEKMVEMRQLRKNYNEINNEREALQILRKENEELIKAIGQRETFAVQSEEKLSYKYSAQAEKDLREHQVSNTSDITHTSIESLKTITDLEKIIQDKNRTITTLQSDVTYLKTIMAESETKLLDVTKELEVSKENCHQLSCQLKKIVHQKNEELADLKKQVSKMTANENRATQIIKVSAKYRAMILKRIAELRYEKSNPVLKELTNFGNSNNCDNELRRSLNASSITMEDLENFLETTERHIRKCSEKQSVLQKERDRLTEVNRIHESEIINLKKFLTELSVSFQTFSSVKDLYAQKLSRVISVQRTVRREILNLDGHITDKCMGKLERGYAAVMQDLAECAMNLERWVERCIGRTISAEKLKQAFMSDNERSSLATTTFQNAGLEVQLEELEKSFQKLLEDVTRAPKGDGAADPHAVTVMEVRAEYEDKLSRMKAKMKQLYTEQIAVFKDKQKEELTTLERELTRARDNWEAKSKKYEEHIRHLTSELWKVGEKLLVKKDEAEWLRRHQRSGSLMSLQHVHSSGLVPPPEEPFRPSDSHSLRSLPVCNNDSNKREGRGLHMSDEEGEVFDNRWLKELSATPRRESAVAPGQRLSELRWRNSLCPPHLKSSYPAETQFTQALDEEDIKSVGAPGPVAGKQQRKEVGIIAYKKPGPPTPSKQAGRLSATDSELRESLRVEADPQPRKTSTPSRIRSLFRSRNDTTEGTPRKRLSNIFRKK